MKRHFSAAFAAALLGAVLLLVYAGSLEINKSWRNYNQEVVNLELPTGEVERCLTCHAGIEEISPSHPIETMGCVSCHGGNGLALEQDTAHEGLRGGRNPAALEVAGVSCGGSSGQCHSGRGSLYQSPAETVPRMPMATKAGEIWVTGRNFGWWDLEQYSSLAVKKVVESVVPLPPDLLNDRGLKGPGAVLEAFDPLAVGGMAAKLEDNCLTYCHLNTGAEEKQTDPAPERNHEHLGGCSACHVDFQSGSTYQGGDPTIDPAEPGHAPRHQLNTAVAYTTCNSCHNQGIHSEATVEFHQREDVPAGAITDPRADRDTTYYIPQATYAVCEVKLDCIDCHTRNEIMGDGHLYGNKAAAQVIRCYNCHGTLQAPPAWKRVTEADDPAIWAARYQAEGFPEVKPGDYLAVTDRGEPMHNVRLEDGRAVLYSKIDGRKMEIPQVTGSACQQDPAEQQGEQCHSCHDISG